MESVRVTKSGEETGLKEGLLECTEEGNGVVVVAEGIMKKLMVMEAWP